MQPAKATPIDVVVSRLRKLGINADDSDYPGEWYLLSSDNYADDASLYKALCAKWPTVVSGYWGYFALIHCEAGYDYSYEDSGVWLHYLLDASGHVRHEFAVGPHRVETW